MHASNDGDHWMLRLETGEELLETLGGFAGAQAIRAAAIGMGIGQLRSATLGFWNGQEYDSKEIAEPVELISLAGSIARSEDRPSVHLHASVGLRDHSTASGHVLRGTVGLLAEVLLVAFPHRAFSRPLDESYGLRTLRLDPPDGPAASEPARPLQ